MSQVSQTPNQFRGFVCWHSDLVARAMDTEATQPAKHFFLATHHPITMRHVEPMGAEDDRGMLSQEEFRDRFLGGQTQVLAAICGTAGSGKSHLVQWLAYHVHESAQRRVVFIPKVGTNLKGVIQLILRGMEGPIFDQYRDRLSRATSALTIEKARLELLARLAIETGPQGETAREELPTNKQKQERKYLIDNLPTLLNDEVFRRELMRNSTIVDEIARHVVGEAGRERRENRRQFTIEDFQFNKWTPIDSDLNKQSRQFFATLRQLPMRQAMVDWLNRNLDVAIGRLLDLGHDDLSGLMLEVREELGKQGKELVLLIEDFAKLQGIDLQLMDALLVRPEQAGRKLCLLRTALAVTTGYYQKLEETVRSRVDLAVNLDLPGIGTQGALTPEALAKFAFRYLNAVRVGENELQAWNADVNNRDTEPPNRCIRCPFRDECHPNFGNVVERQQPIGLYPFTPQALFEMYDRAARNRGDVAASFNPRVLINDVLKPILTRGAEEVPANRFPSKAVQDLFGDPRMSNIANQSLQGQVSNAQLLPRYRALAELWGDDDFKVKSPVIYEAFLLPPLRQDADDSASVGTIEADTATDDALTVSGLDEQETKPRPGATTTAKGQTAANGGKAVVEQADDPATRRLKERLGELEEWSSRQQHPLSQDLATILRERLFPVLDSYIDWDAEMLASQFYVGQAKTFRQTSIYFKGQGTADASPPVLLKLPLNDNWLQASMALQGLLQYGHYGHWNFADGDQYFRAYAECLEMWSREVVQQVRQLATEKEEWNPVPAIVEALVIGARLKGYPEQQSDEEALNALFLKWDEPLALPNSPRTQEWQTLQKYFTEQGSSLQEVLLSRIGCHKGGQLKDSSGFKVQVIDVAAILPALRQIQNSWQPVEQIPLKPRSDYDIVRKARERVDKSLTQALSGEATRFAEWHEQVQSHLAPDAQPDALKQIIDVAIAKAQDAGVSPSSNVESTLETAAHRFEPVLLAECRQVVQTVTNLNEPRDGFVLLSQLATLEPMAATHDFIESADKWLLEAESRVAQGIADLQSGDDEDVAALHKSIADGLQVLCDITADVAGNEISAKTLASNGAATSTPLPNGSAPKAPVPIVPAVRKGGRAHAS